MEKQSGENEAEECSDQEQIAHRKCSCRTSTFKTIKWVYVTLFSLLCNIAFIVLFVIVFRELNKLNAKCMDKTWSSSSLNANALRLHFTVPPPKSNGADDTFNINRTFEKENTTIRPGEESRIVTLLNENEQHTTSRLTRRSTADSLKPTRPAPRHKKRKNGRKRHRSGSCSCRDIKGSRGHPGQKGDPGPQGPRGKRGLRGQAGNPGHPGIAGMPGQRGLQGPQGPSGLKGDQGLQGPPGLQGPKGDTGEKGQIGKRGPYGVKGDKGDKGDRGPIGMKGEKGETGSLESNPRPSAHLTGKTKSSQHLDTGILRNWKDNMDYAHAIGGMQHINGDLIIPKRGRYYVYSQLYFRTEKVEHHLVHFMHHTPVNRTRVVLMRSLTTSCKNNKIHLFSSYQGGVFHLQTGDKLTVGVSKGEIGKLVMADTASFFGAFMI